MRTFPTSAVWCFGILFISASLITTGSSEVQVVGLADTVVALAGDDVILPCSLEPNVSAEEMTVQWTRLYLRTTEIVHLYHEGRDSYVDQFPSYRGRTSMFHEELKNGIVSLKLNRVTLSDAGSYRCFIPTLTSQVKETTVQLIVGAVSQPLISIVGINGLGVVLKCESGGWFPEPKMEFLDSSGTILPADGPPERHIDSEGLYTVRRHVTVDQTDTNRFTCRVQQPEINHLKEIEIHVPDDVFPILTSSWNPISIVVILAAVIVGVIASAGVYMWIKHTEDKLKRELKRDAQFVDIHKVHLIKNVTTVTPIAFYFIHSERYSEIHAARTREDQMKLLYKALEEAEDTREDKVKSDFYRILLDLEPDVLINLGAKFVDVHKDQLIQMVTMVKPIMYELFYKELYCNIRIKEMTRQDQMRQLYKALEEAEDSRIVKLDFYRILLDREPDLVKNLGEAEETIQSLSTSPGGQQETQTPSQKSERIEGMEMKSLPGSGRKSVPEMKPLLAAGPQNDDLDEMERGGRVTTDNNSML
ncbi:butyrophilin subfamily 1 member A1 isoform X2 [Oncorhynchus kisutch]|uniref:Butyrophilin subfamily 1 member A1 n=1 Tax=Oncorhynchus kisutch TaxID=8019 RepID=A0A8C7FG32_ONCKI|nr:butyrophilin subfamily 1 member A1 isoform X2 [Oncorhynchus kisutch]